MRVGIRPSGLCLRISALALVTERPSLATISRLLRPTSRAVITHMRAKGEIGRYNRLHGPGREFQRKASPMARARKVLPKSGAGRVISSGTLDNGDALAAGAGLRHHAQIGFECLPAFRKLLLGGLVGHRCEYDDVLTLLPVCRRCDRVI